MSQESVPSVLIESSPVNLELLNAFTLVFQLIGEPDLEQVIDVGDRHVYEAQWKLRRGVVARLSIDKSFQNNNASVVFRLDNLPLNLL